MGTNVTILTYLAAVLGAYLLGAIPVGLVVVRAVNGGDIRTVGSGRTGGTNALRAAGPVAGVLTGLGDMAKGFAAVHVARLLLPGDPVLEALCGVAAVAGHNWPVYIKFRGGAGTGPNAGAAVALWPVSAAIVVPIVPLALVLTGYASVTSTLASLAIVVIFAVRMVMVGSPFAYVGYSIATTLLVAIALIPNYKRLIAGTERLVGPRAKAIAHRSE